MLELNKSTVSGVLVRNDDGKFLLVKKVAGVGPYAGTYLPPGGGIESTESVKAAALRELYEETGVKVTNLQPACIFKDTTLNHAGVMTQYTGYLFTADYATGELGQTAGNDDEFEDVGWFTLEELASIPLSPPAKRLIEQVTN